MYCGGGYALPPAMATQLDRLVSLSRLPNVTIGVLPLSRLMLQAHA
ncbi:Scr1 family TA system antitoxin-like transcriptional regulator [Kitasatospora sp. NPDC088351]